MSIVKVKVGEVILGDGVIKVQSMTKTPTSDVSGVLAEIEELKKEGCEIVRVGIPSEKEVYNFKKIVEKSTLPVVADIHFNYEIAIKAMEYGAQKIRINPGNLGGEEKFKKVLEVAKYYDVPVRIGVNAGSISLDILERNNYNFAEAMVESALKWVRFAEREKFYNIVVSVKHSDVHETVKAYRLLSGVIPYPLHVGITEAGPPPEGIYKSVIGIGSLLIDGIGDTIRVSLTGSSVEEVRVAYQILESLGLRLRHIQIISCPMCARKRVDVEKLVNEFRDKIRRSNLENIPLKVAIMGCEVNGPGEARQADIGIAPGLKYSLLFKKGKIIKKVPNDKAIDFLIEEIKKWKN